MVVFVVVAVVVVVVVGVLLQARETVCLGMKGNACGTQWVAAIVAVAVAVAVGSCSCCCCCCFCRVYWMEGCRYHSYVFKCLAQSANNVCLLSLVRSSYQGTTGKCEPLSESALLLLPWIQYAGLSFPRHQNSPKALYSIVFGPKRLKKYGAQKPYIVWSLGPKALIYESLEPKGLIAGGGPRRTASHQGVDQKGDTDMLGMGSGFKV